MSGFSCTPCFFLQKETDVGFSIAFTLSESYESAVMSHKFQVAPLISYFSISIVDPRDLFHFEFVALRINISAHVLHF